MALLGQLSAWNCSAGNIRSAGPRICEKRAEIGSVCEDDAIAYPVPLRTERAFRAQCSIVTVSAGLEQLTLNQRVQGSSPCAPTNLFEGLGASSPEHARPVGSLVGRFRSRFELGDRLSGKPGITV